MLKKLTHWCHLVIKDPLLRGTAILSFTNFFGGIFSLLTQSYIGRNLSKNEFGLLNTIFSISILSAVFLSAHKYWIIQSYSMQRDSLLVNLKTLYHHLLLMFSIIVMMGVFIFVFKTQIYDWLKFESLSILWLFLLFNLVMFLTSPLAAYFQSNENFLVYGIGSFIKNSFKFFFLSIFLFHGLTSENAYLSFMLAGLLGFLFYAFLLIKKVSMASLFEAFYSKAPRSTRYVKETGEFLQYFSSAFLFAALFNFDIVLVRYLLSSEISGDYAAASLMGKAIYFLSAVILEVFYPSVVKIKNRAGKLYPILNKGLLISCGISVLGFLAIYFLVHPINTHFFLGKFDNSIYLIRLYALFTLIMVINSVYIHFLIALKNFFFLSVLSIFPLIQFFVIRYFAETALDVVYINNVVAFSLLSLFFVNHVGIFLKKR